VVLSADRPPGDLSHLGAELSARLSGGLACGLLPLDRDTRLHVLRQLALRREMSVPEAVLQTIAERTGGDARQLSGVLNRLRANSHASQLKISPRMAAEVIDELLPPAVRLIRLTEIEHAVRGLFALEPGVLQADVRTRAVSHPRMLAMWLARKYTSACLTEISEYFGRRSHSTVVSAEKTVRDWLEKGTQLRLGHRQMAAHDVVRQLEEMLKAA
jgi:chromosomal replication initiator protein